MDLFDLVHDNMSRVTGDLKHIVDSISSTRSLSEEEFIKICSFIRDLKFMVNEIEYNARIKPMTDDLKAVLRSLKSTSDSLSQSFCSIDMEKRARKQKNIK